MNQNNLTTKENDKKGTSINPRGLKMTLEVKFNNSMVRSLFDGTFKKEHQKFYYKTQNREKFLTPELKESYEKSLAAKFFTENFLPFKSKVDDLEDALLIADKYVGEHLKRNLIGHDFVLFGELDQANLVTCVIKVSGMITGEIRLSSASVYRVDPVSTERKEVVYTSQYAKELFSNSEKKDQTRRALLDIADLIGSYFDQIRNVYQNYSNMLQKNFSYDEVAKKHLDSSLHYFLNPQKEKFDVDSSISTVTSFQECYCSFTNSKTVLNKPIFKNFNFSPTEQYKINYALSFLITCRNKNEFSSDLESVNSIALSEMFENLERYHYVIDIREMALSPISDKEEYTAADESDFFISSRGINQSARYQIGLLFCAGHIFSFIKEKDASSARNMIIGFSSDNEDQIPQDKRSRMSSYDNKKVRIYTKANPSDVFQVLNYSRELATKILLMTESFAAMINKSNNLINFHQELKKIFTKYELDEKEFFQQFL